MQHPKPNVEIDGTDVTAHLRGTVRVAQDPPDDAPSEFEMTEEQEQKPGANWRDLYLQPVIRAIRNRFDLPKGSVTLVGPKKKTPFGDDSLGFELTGHVRFEDFKPPTKQYGRAPYRFTCSVSPEGELLLPVELQGSPVE